jgi:hypothetical protein
MMTDGRVRGALLQSYLLEKMVGVQKEVETRLDTLRNGTVHTREKDRTSRKDQSAESRCMPYNARSLPFAASTSTRPSIAAVLPSSLPPDTEGMGCETVCQARAPRPRSGQR